MPKMASFKVYLSTKEGPPEIRRFMLDYENLTYASLAEKIRTIFPSLRDKQFGISWKDSEMEMVEISSEQELQIFQYETGYANTNRLYVRILDNQKSQASEGPVHFGVTCDVCQKGIRGFRYKCLNCPNYDLCAKCEYKGNHNMHSMLRISYPMGDSSMHRLEKHCESVLHRMLSKPRSGHRDKSRKCPIEPFAFDFNLGVGESMLRNIISDFIGVQKPDAPTAGQENKSEAPQSQPENKGEAPKSQPEEKPQATPSQTSSAEVFHDAPTTSANADKMETETASNYRKLYPEMADLIDKARDMEVTVSPGTSSGGSQCSERNGSECEDWTMLSVDFLSSSQPSAPTEAKVAEAAEAAEAASEQPAQPQLPKQDKIVYHSDPAIQSAVETMVQMGFGDDSNLLTRLLVAMNGDINRALDVLQPKTR